MSHEEREDHSVTITSFNQIRNEVPMEWLPSVHPVLNDQRSHHELTPLGQRQQVDAPIVI